MIYPAALDSITSRLADRPSLQYVHQAAGGEFIASNGHIMLIDARSAGGCCLSPWWQLQTPATPPASPDPLNRWAAVLSHAREDARRRWVIERITYEAGLARLQDFFVNERYFKIALEFTSVAGEPVLLIPSTLGAAVLLYVPDNSRIALIMPYDLYPETVERAKWDVLDDSGTIIYTTKILPEAESFGFTVRLHKD